MPVTEKSKANLAKNAGAFKKNTREAQRKIARMGAEASNRKQKQKKTLAELADIFGNLKVVDEKEKKNLQDMGVADEDMIQDMAMMVGLYRSAKRCNSNSARVLAELKGALKQAQTNVVVNNVNPFAELTDDELRKLASGE